MAKRDAFAFREALDESERLWRGEKARMWRGRRTDILTGDGFDDVIRRGA